MLVKRNQELQVRDLRVRVRTGLRKRGNKTKYLLNGWLPCDACREVFALSNGTRYQCASHHDGGDAACSLSHSVPRDRIERVFMRPTPRLPLPAGRSARASLRRAAPALCTRACPGITAAIRWRSAVLIIVIPTARLTPPDQNRAPPQNRALLSRR